MSDPKVKDLADSETSWEYSLETKLLKFSSNYLCIRNAQNKKKGRGMFATRDIPGGTLIIREDAILICDDTPEAVYSTYQTLNTKLRGTVNALKYDKTLTCPYQRFRSMMCNAVRNDSVYYLYMSAGLINHSCYPNAFATSYMGVLCVVTLGTILAGDEIGISYSNSIHLPIELRQESFVKKGWACLCDLCDPDGPGVIGWAVPELSDCEGLENGMSFNESCEVGRRKFSECLEDIPAPVETGEGESGPLIPIERLIRLFYTTMTAAGVSMGYRSIAPEGLDIRNHPDLDLKNLNMNPFVYSAVLKFIDYLVDYNFHCPFTGKIAKEFMLSMLDYAILVAEVRYEHYTNAYIGHVLLKCVLIRLQ